MTEAPTMTLLPCPFCGGPAHGPYGPNEEAACTVECGWCAAEMVDETRVKAIAAWNRRTPPQPADDSKDG